MAGSKAGGIKAAETNRRRYGEDYFRRIGAEGGRSGKTGGFASTVVGRDGLTGQQRAEKYGAIGGKISKRGKRH